MGSAVWESPNLREWSIWQENAWDFFEYLGVNRIVLKRILTLNPLTWKIWWANNASRWQMGLNSAFKGLKKLLGWLGWVVLSEEGCGLSRTWQYTHGLIKTGNFVGFWSKCMLLKEVWAPESYCTRTPTLFCESKCPSRQELQPHTLRLICAATSPSYPWSVQPKHSYSGVPVILPDHW